MYAFLSYQTEDKAIAGEVRKLLSEIGVDSFLAHEDIQVSYEWRGVLLSELAKADLFVAILSERYHQSVWCVQESGVAAFRGDVSIIPLSIDGTIPHGFFNHIQSVKLDPNNIALSPLLPGLAALDFNFVFDALTERIRRTTNFRAAEAHFQAILPYVGRASDAQKAELLKVSIENDQVLHAHLCAVQYLPPLMASQGHALEPNAREAVQVVLNRYAKGRR